MRRCPVFFTDAPALLWECALPARQWIPVDSTIGGVRIAAGGAPTSYLVRRDGLLELTLRFRETEYADLAAVIAYGQGGGILKWMPDALGSDLFDVYLETPAMGERWQPTPSEYPRVLEQVLVLRGVSELPWIAYFEG